MKVDLLEIFQRSFHDAKRKHYYVYGNDLYLYSAIDWLKKAQDVTGDGGVSAQYSLIHGWDDSYIETTGYILVSFFQASHTLSIPELFHRAVQMADFLIRVQLKSGAFQSGTPQDFPPTPRVFNTGEVVRGLVRAYRETKKKRYLAAATRASDWLLSIQEADGSWVQDEFQSRKHAYHSRTAWALLEVWKETKQPKYRTAALEALHWVLKQQLDNGWFSSCDFSNPPDPFTHAIDYTVSGLLESAKILQNKKYYEAGKRCADALLAYYMRYSNMPATFTPKWTSNDHYSCLTGNAQIVFTWFELFIRTKQIKYKKAALKLLNELKQTIDLHSQNFNIRGAVAGAYPIYGGYSRYNYPNWATKFLLDTCLYVYEKKFDTKQ